MERASPSSSTSVWTPFALAHSGGTDLAFEERVAVNAAYFDALLTRVPASVYFQREEEGEANVGYVGEVADGAATKYMKHRDGGGSSIAVAKAAHKSAKGSDASARRVRFDVEAQKSIPVLQAQLAKASLGGGAEAGAGASAPQKRKRAAGGGSAELEGADMSDSDTEVPVRKTSSSASAFFASGQPIEGATGSSAASLDDLRARLHARIKELQQSRKSTADEVDGSELGAEAGAARSASGAAHEGRADKAAKRGSTREEGRDASKKTQANGTKGAKVPARGAVASAPRAAAAAAEAAAGAKPATQNGAARGRALDAKRGNDAKRPRIEKSNERSGSGKGGSVERKPATGAGAGSMDIDFAFGAIADGGVAAPSAGAPPEVKHGSKEHKLRSLLAKAKKTQSKLEKLSSGETGTGVKVSHEFDVAMRRAEGEKVLDDPTLIAKSLKRIAKRKQKSAAAWAERSAKVAETQAARATERNENVKTKKYRAQYKAALNAEVAAKAARSAKAAAAAGGVAPMDGPSGGSGGAKAPKRRPGFEGHGRGK